MNGFVEGTLSEFLQESGKFLAYLEAGRDVLLRRRSKPSLILTDARREQLLRDALRTAARLTLAALGDHPEDNPDLVERVADRIHWLGKLPGDERREFLRDFARTAAAAVETGGLAGLDPLLRLEEGWEVAAEAYLNPRLSDALTARAERPTTRAQRSVQAS
jgi:hypothetical protein